MDPLSLPVVHPSFEKLKNSGNWLHLTAALLILAHALSHIHQQELKPVYFWCQLLIAVDILLLVLAGKKFLLQMPAINLFFRVVEVLFFSGIGIIMFIADKPFSGIFHICLGIAYVYLIYCERNSINKEILSFYHTGIDIPEIPSNKFLYWSEINHIEAHYDCICIETSTNKKIDLNLRKNLGFEELDQIHEFCRYYLKSDKWLTDNCRKSYLLRPSSVICHRSTNLNNVKSISIHSLFRWKGKYF
jgi:hypothetical protein